MIQEDKSNTLATSNDQFLCFLDIPDKVGTICEAISKGTSNQIVGGEHSFDTPLCDGFKYKASAEARGIGYGKDSVPTISTNANIAVLCVAADPYNGAINGDKSSTIGVNCCTHYGEPATCYLVPCDIILRRLTPTECARLQGMPDWWCDDVPHADSAEYKMWGNGMALPNVLYVLEGIVEAMKGERNEQIH